MKLKLLVTIVCIFVGTFAVTQEGVPSELLARTKFIKVGNEGGTGFAIDYKDKIYIVTARHVVAHLPTGDTNIQVMKSGQWLDVHITRTLFPPSPDVDIAVLETNMKVVTPFTYTMPASAEAGVTMGQQVFFLGYPYGLGSHWKTGEAPFIKRGTMSAIDETNPDAVVMYIDGFNNPGFSGGPIVYWDFKNNTYRILGIVKGYREDTAKVLVNGQQTDTAILVNSGILIGYSIQYALKAIEGK